MAIERYDGSLKDSSNLFGVYRAVVEDNMDPLKIGRVRIRVPMVHGYSSSGVKTADLPWASPCMPSAGYGYGSFIVPEVGEYVFVMFEDQDVSKPIYIGSSYGVGASKSKVYGSKDGQGQWCSDAGLNEVPADAQRDEPTKKIVYKSPKGSSIEVDEENGNESISIIDPLGQTIKFESNLTKGVKHKRYSGDADTLEPDDTLTSGSRVVLLDYHKQKLEMKSDEENSSIVLEGRGGQKVDMQTSSDSSSISMGTKNIELVISEKNGVASVEIRNSSGMKINISNEGKVSLFGSTSVDLSAPNINLSGKLKINESASTSGSWGGSSGSGASSEGGSIASKGDLAWPIDFKTVTTYSGHGAIDIPTNKTTGHPIYAAADGVVSREYSYSANNYPNGSGTESWGNYIRLSHPQFNIETGYAHLESFAVSQGESVTKGQIIGYSGNSGNSSGPHLHFEIYVGGRRISTSEFYNYYDLPAGLS